MVNHKKRKWSRIPDEIHLQPAAPSAASSELNGPFVAYFASGYCPEEHEACSFKVHRNTKRPREHCLVTEKDKVDFVGSTVDTQGPPSCGYAVGLLDRRTGIMKYMEVSGGSIIRMEPHARGTSYGPSGHTTELEETAQARRAQNERLVHAFGSTRRQRQLKERDLAQVVGDNVEASGAVQEILDAAGEKAAQAKATKDEIVRAITGIRNIPPHHAEATAASEAYRLDELMPAGVRESLDVSRLERAAEDLEYRDSVLRAEDGVPDLVLGRLALITKPQSQAGAARLRALAFLAALLRLHTGRRQHRVKPRESMQALAERTGVQASVLQPLLEQYYGAEESEEGHMVYKRTQEQERAMLLCLLMTALIAEDYDLGARQFEALRAALKLTSGDLRNYYREMGCTMEKMAEPGSPNKQYRVRLLPQGSPGMPAKTLGEAFPKLAIPRARKK